MNFVGFPTVAANPPKFDAFLARRRRLLTPLRRRGAEALAAATTSEAAQPHVAAARETLQRLDSRLGFEASNHYFFVPVDLAEKMLNCQDLLDEWATEQQRRFG